MNIVITGGMGFIGANLAINLSKNNKIIIIDNLLRKENKKNYKKLKDISQIFIEDVSSIKKIKNIDCILHLASDPSVMAGISYKSNIIKTIRSTKKLDSFADAMSVIAAIAVLFQAGVMKGIQSIIAGKDALNSIINSNYINWNKVFWENR